LIEPLNEREASIKAVHYTFYLSESLLPSRHIW